MNIDIRNKIINIMRSRGFSLIEETKSLDSLKFKNKYQDFNDCLVIYDQLNSSIYYKFIYRKNNNLKLSLLYENLFNEDSFNSAMTKFIIEQTKEGL